MPPAPTIRTPHELGARTATRASWPADRRQVAANVLEADGARKLPERRRGRRPQVDPARGHRLERSTWRQPLVSGHLAVIDRHRGAGRQPRGEEPGVEAA
jgi:hypothetical protein